MRAPTRRATASPTPGAAEIAGVRITHPDRIVYPPQGITKLDLARFYESIADWILPNLRGRPTSLVRCPEGIGEECFYQKHAGGWAPATLRRVRIQEKKKVGEYLVVEDLAGLIGLVQFGILEIHTWNAIYERLEQPDRLVFDLDPGDDVPWRDVVAGARTLRTHLQSLGLESFLKTTGGKGLHLVVPIGRGPSWDDCLAFARSVAEDLARTAPSAFTADVAKRERQRPHLSRLPAQPARRYVSRRVLDTGATGCTRVDTNPLGGARTAPARRPLHGREPATPALVPEGGSLGRVRAHPPAAAGAPPVSDPAPQRRAAQISATRLGASASSAPAATRRSATN